MLDLLVVDALIVDGTGSPAFRGSVGVRDDRIVWIGRGDTQVPEATRPMDAGGRVLAPGFVDVHTHSDLAPLVEPGFRSCVRQGITTGVVGNCGASAWPRAGAAECSLLVGAEPAKVGVGWPTFGDYLEAMQRRRPAVNVAALVGHGAIRMEAMGTEARAPTDEELGAMRRMVADAMQAGAFGLSTGLIYVPGIYTATDEIVALAGEAARRGGLYASHIRGEGEHLFRAVDEAIEVGRRARLPAHVSHLKCETSLVWGRAEELLDRVRGADDVTADQYPYTAWASSLSSLLPAWARVAEVATIAREERERLRAAVEEGEPDFQSSVRGVGWDRIVVEATAERGWNGASVAAVADALRVEPFDAFVALLDRDRDTSCIGHAMDEADVRTIVADPQVMVASDAVAMAPDGPLGRLPVHPRNYGTFPRVLARYVRGERALTLEAAIRKMTSLPADRFGLDGRGSIVEGALADLVLFDPTSVADEATFEAPHRFASGIDLVVVNGRVAWDGREGERPGRVLRR